MTTNILDALHFACPVCDRRMDGRHDSSLGPVFKCPDGCTTLFPSQSDIREAFRVAKLEIFEGVAKAKEEAS